MDEVLLCFVSPVKFETQKFVEEELSNITMPEMKGKEGRFQYTITKYRRHVEFTVTLRSVNMCVDTFRLSCVSSA